MPAPTVITDSDLSGLLKNVYANYRLKVQNTVTPLLAQLQKAKAGGLNNLRWGGNGVYWDVTTGRPAGGSFSPAGFFPIDTFAQEKQANSGVARAYVTRQIDGLAFVGTQSKDAAFETLTRKTMTEIKDASRLLMQQSLHHSGNGVFALITSSADTTHCVVTSPYGVSGAGQGSLCISVGDTIVVRDTTGATRRGSAQVTAISVSGDNSTLTLGAAISGMTNTDLVCKGPNSANGSDDSYSATLGANAFNGLIGITNRGGSYNTLHGLSAATYGILNPIAMVAGTDTPDAAQPTESDLWDLFQRVAGKSGKSPLESPDEFLLISTPGVGKKLMESVLGQRRFDAATTSKSLKMGYKAVEVCGLPLIMDYYVPAGTIYLVHIPSLAWLDAKDWGFVEFEGAGPWRWIQGRDAFETTYGYYGNMLALQRNSHASITGYTDTVRYSHVASA